MRRQINGSGLIVNPVGLDGVSPYRSVMTQAFLVSRGEAVRHASSEDRVDENVP